MRAVIPVAVCLGLFGAALDSRMPEPIGSDGQRVPAAHLPVHVITAIPLSDAELETLRDQLTRIWQPEGIVIEMMTDPPQPGGLRLVLSEAPIRASRDRSGLCALGVIRFIDGTPQPELTVSVTAVRAFVRQAVPQGSPGLQSLMAARVMGRVAAHELGHYLLAESGHRPRGLMRARFDGANLLAPHLAPFLPPPRTDLEAGLKRLMRLSPPTTDVLVESRMVIDAALAHLPADHLPTVPVRLLDPGVAPTVLLRQAGENCAFVPNTTRHVIFVVTTCGYIERGRAGDALAVMAMAALIAHEQAHVAGADELQARAVEARVFKALVAAATATLRTQQILAAAVHLTALQQQR